MYYPTYRTKKNGVPILKKEEIEILAERYILDFCPEALIEPQSIDIDLFVTNYLKLNQDFQYLSHCGLYLGMIVFNNTNNVVVYNPVQDKAEYLSAKEGTVIIDNTLLDEQQEHRYRFTMGHEGVHWILHRAVFQYDSNQLSMSGIQTQSSVQCRAASIDYLIKPISDWTDKDSMEWQANYMSSCILMPKSMVIKLIENLPNQNNIYRFATYINEVVKTFNVSYQAAGYRLKELGLIKGTNLNDCLTIEYDEPMPGKKPR